MRFIQFSYSSVTYKGSLLTSAFVFLVIFSYSLPIGHKTARGKVQFRDTTYNGKIDSDFNRKGGTGILTDGKFGPADAKQHSGKGWVGWSSELTASQYITITFEFSEVRKFKDVRLFVNVDKDNAVFVTSRILFASTNDGFSNSSYLQYCPNNVQYNGQNAEIAVISLPLCDNEARFVKLQLFFGGKWLLLTEIIFNSGT